MDVMNEQTQIAVMQNDLSHMKGVLDEIKGDLKEMKGAYVMYVQYAQDVKEQHEKNNKFMTLDQFNDKFGPYQKITVFVASVILVQLISIIFQYFTSLPK